MSVGGRPLEALRPVGGCVISSVVAIVCLLLLDESMSAKAGLQGSAVNEGSRSMTEATDAQRWRFGSG